MVTTSIGQQCAEHVTGIHVNMPVVNFGECDITDVTEQEAGARTVAEHADWGTGYSAEQSTRPQTLGYGLTDSPAGSAPGCSRSSGPGPTATAPGEGAHQGPDARRHLGVLVHGHGGIVGAALLGELQVGRHGTGHVPVGVSSFPKEILGVSERWARRRFTDLRWFDAPREGGSLRRLQQPEIFVEEVRGIFRTVR